MPQREIEDAAKCYSRVYGSLHRQAVTGLLVWRVCLLVFYSRLHALSLVSMKASLWRHFSFSTDDQGNTRNGILSHDCFPLVDPIRAIEAISSCPI